MKIEIPTAHSPYLLQLLCGRDLPLETYHELVCVDSFGRWNLASNYTPRKLLNFSLPQRSLKLRMHTLIIL
jgi:hypothetical protein